MRQSTCLSRLLCKLVIKRLIIVRGHIPSSLSRLLCKLVIKLTVTATEVDGSMSQSPIVQTRYQTKSLNVTEQLQKSQSPIVQTRYQTVSVQRRCLVGSLSRLLCKLVIKRCYFSQKSKKSVSVAYCANSLSNNDKHRFTFKFGSQSPIVQTRYQT